MATMPHWAAITLASVVVGVSSLVPVLAQSSRSGDATLSQANPSATVRGTTAGIMALSNLTVRDHHGLICTGFADSTPDHVLILEEDFAQLTLQVNSGGNDTTLLVQGPAADVVRCGEDTSRRNPDAKLQGQNWPAGTYRVWVGAHQQGQRHSYTLTISP